MWEISNEIEGYRASEIGRGNEIVGARAYFEGIDLEEETHISIELPKYHSRTEYMIGDWVLFYDYGADYYFCARLVGMD